MMPDNADLPYKAPKLKMKLKETAAEKEEKQWRKERKRLRKESKQIYAANGISPTAGKAVTPPRARKEDSMSPPRKRRRGSDADERGGAGGANPGMADWDESVWGAAPLPHKRYSEAAARMREDEEYRQKLFDMMEDDEGPNAFVSGSYHDPEPVQHGLPVRWQGSGGGTSGLPGDELDEEGYAESIRYGMWKRKNKDEAERLERLERWKKDEAARKAKEKAFKDEEGRRRMEVIQAERGKAEQRRLDQEVAEYREKWQNLKAATTKSTEEQTSSRSSTREPSPPLRLFDLPWPIFHPPGPTTFSIECLQLENIKLFFTAIAAANPPDSSTNSREDEGKLPMRKILREAILAYHPDRFVGRHLSSVREEERQGVKDAVVRCSQVINQLASDLKE